MCAPTALSVLPLAHVPRILTHPTHPFMRVFGRNPGSSQGGILLLFCVWPSQWRPMLRAQQASFYVLSCFGAQFARGRASFRGENVFSAFCTPVVRVGDLVCFECA